MGGGGGELDEAECEVWEEGSEWIEGGGVAGAGRDGGRVGCWERHSGGVALLNHRLRADTPAGVRFHFVWYPVVSLEDSLNHRLRAVIPAG